jgi:hypothetical protein
MNKNQVIVYLICGGLGVVVIGIVLYYILRWLKGSVRLEVENRAYRPGEIIHGVVHLKCRGGTGARLQIQDLKDAVACVPNYFSSHVYPLEIADGLGRLGAALQREKQAFCFSSLARSCAPIRA